MKTITPANLRKTQEIFSSDAYRLKHTFNADIFVYLGGSWQMINPDACITPLWKYRIFIDDIPQDFEFIGLEDLTNATIKD